MHTYDKFEFVSERIGLPKGEKKDDGVNETSRDAKKTERGRSSMDDWKVKFFVTNGGNVALRLLST